MNRENNQIKGEGTCPLPDISPNMELKEKGSMSIVGLDRVGAEAPARFLRITEENPFSEIRKVTLQ